MINVALIVIFNCNLVNNMKKLARKILFFAFIFAVVVSVFAVDVPISTFPLDKYDQNISAWINPSDTDHDKPLIQQDEQDKFLKEYYNHYYATDEHALSPWSASYVATQIKDIYQKQKAIIDDYDNSLHSEPKQIVYGVNYQPYDHKWIDSIRANINLNQFQIEISFESSNCAITVKNLSARELPTLDPGFYNHAFAGEGYPFDNLQSSAIWVGTPIYIIGTTLDQQWSLVLTPHSFMAWVPSDGVAKTSADFISKWQEHAKKHLVAITKTNTSIYSEHKYKFNTYVGTVFPAKTITDGIINEILIPVTDDHGNARIVTATLGNNNDAVIMPLKATPRNFAAIISTLTGRPYGWGGMYFYNDCSAELQSLYAPFGIWLPRNTSAQISHNSDTRKIIDLSAETIENGLKYLIKNGKKLTTIIYVNGHVMLYTGNYANPGAQNELVAMTYQSTWGLKPDDGSYRAVIGKSVFIPLLKQYPEDLKLSSWTKNFKLLFLGNVKDNKEL
jgi:cell wall-associated NlpC family hydrolase